MARDYEPYLNKLVTNSIETKGYMLDIICGIKELSGKLDTLIALETVGATAQQRQQQQHDTEDVSRLTKSVIEEINNIVLKTGKAALLL